MIEYDDQPQALHYRGKVNSMPPTHPRPVGHQGECSTIEAQQWREKPGLQVHDERDPPHSQRYDTLGQEHLGLGPGHINAYNPYEEQHHRPPGSEVYPNQLPASPSTLPGASNPIQRPMSRNRSSATPVPCLGRSPALVDCPSCGIPAMTRTSYEIGNTTQYVSA